MHEVIETIRLQAEMLDSLGIGVCLFDQDHRTLLWNRSFLELFPEHDGHVHAGEPYADNLRRFYRLRLSEAEQPWLERHVADGIARHRTQHLPFVFEHRGQWLRVASLPVPPVGRLRIWARIAGPDEPRLMRDALARSDRGPQEAVIDDLADGLMLRSFAGDILQVNRRFRLLYRLAGNIAVEGQSFAQLLASIWGDDPMLQAALAASVDNQRFVGAAYEIPLPGGRWMRISEQPTRDGTLVSTHVDITELRRLQREADAARASAEATTAALVQQTAERERAEAALHQVMRIEAIGQLTGGMAHDFNNLLSVVLGNIDLLEEDEADPDRLHRLAVMRAAAEKGASLTRQLLAFARRQRLEPRHVSLQALLDAMLPLLRSAVGQRVTLDFAATGDAMTALVDPTQIELIVLNLALNARDAMDGQGRLRIALSREAVGSQQGPDAPKPGDYICISVEDTGAGMAPEVLARAFEPFFTTKPSGSGLGLAQVYGVARQSGGTARIDSTPGQGTRVDVLLPAIAAGPLAPAPACIGRTPHDQAHSPARPPWVLVVDDNADLLDTIAILLESAGYTASQAESGQAALQLLDDQPGIDVLLTDVSMPAMAGPELARQARARHPGLAVVFFSGFADRQTLGPDFADAPLLQKPVRLAALAAAVDAAVAGMADPVRPGA